jgi:hypothetical protein
MLKPIALAMLLCGSVSAQAADNKPNLSMPCGHWGSCGVEFGQVDWSKEYTLYGFHLNYGWIALDNMEQWDACNVPEKRIKDGGKALRDIVGNKPLICAVHDQWGHTGGRRGTCYVNGRQNEILDVSVQMHLKGF